MKNSELLLMGGGDLYAEATHWITVGLSTSGPTETGIGFGDYDTGSASAHFGALSSTVLLGETIACFATFPKATTPITELLPLDAATGAGNWADTAFMITRLDSGLSGKFAYDPSVKFYLWHESTVLLFNESDIGKTIPLKIEVV